jgi:hypothetical protein
LLSAVRETQKKYKKKMGQSRSPPLVHPEGHSAQYSPEQVQKAKKKTPYVSKRKNWAGLRKIISQNLTTSGISRPRAATLVHNKILPPIHITLR